MKLKTGAVLSLSLVICSAIVQSTARADDQPYLWHNARLIGGDVTGIVFHPTTKGVIYVRTATSGAYRWDPKQKSWTCITDWIGNEDWNYDGIESLALDPADPDRVFMAVGTYTNDWAGHGAMLRSTDGGITWEVAPTSFKMGSNETGRNIGERLVVDPNNGKILFFGSRRNGLWRSEDSGETWNRIETFSSEGQTEGVGICFVTFQQQSGLKAAKPTPTIYVGVSSPQAALYQSKDAGATWQPVPNQPAGLLPHRAAWDSNRFLYITYGNQPGPTDNTDGAVYKFDPATSAWTDITPQHPSTDDQFGYSGITIDAQHPSTIVVSTLDRKKNGDDLMRTTDAGKTWHHFGPTAQRDSSTAPWLDDGVKQAPFGPWISDVAIDPFDSSHILCTAPWGLWSSTDANKLDVDQPTHWTIGSIGIEGLGISQVVSPPAGPQILSAGRTTDGFRHDNMDISPPAGTFKPAHGNNTDIDFAAAKPDIVVRMYPVSNQSTGGAYSLDDAITWTEFPTHPKATTQGTIAVSADGATFIWSEADGPAFRSLNHGTTWKPCKGLPPSIVVVSDRVTPANFYAFDQDSQSVYVSTDSGAHFIQAAQDLPDSPGFLRAAPGQPGHLWMATSKGLFRSTDAGTTFTQLGLVQQASQITFGKPSPDGSYPAIYITGRINSTEGLFRSDDEGAIWVRINDDQHKFGAVTSIAGDPRIYGRIYLGSANLAVIYGDPAPIPPPKIKQ